MRSSWSSSIGQDIRYAVRTLRASPGFAVIAILMLSLGIGANTAIFSLMSAVMLQPLPFTEPDRLVVLWENFEPRGGPSSVEITPATYVEWKERTRSFEDMVLLLRSDYNINGAGEPERVTGVRAETNLFQILGVRPTLGRTFVPDDEGPAATPVAIISEALWARRFGADPNVVGRAITLDGLSRTVIGVVPADFRFPSDEVSVWVPAQYTPEEFALATSYTFYVVAKLAPGVSIEAAQAEMDAVSMAIADDRPGSGPAIGATVRSLQSQLGQSARPTLFTLGAAVAVVLLIVCANLANLLLARGAKRRRELAVRKALGAENARVLRLLLTESATLAAIGVVLGVGSAALSFDYLARLMPTQFPADLAPSLNWRVLMFAASGAIVTVMLFGAVPAVHGAQQDVTTALKKGGGTRVTGDGRFRSGLVVAEIALTIVLLAAGGLLLRSYLAVMDLDTGFPTQNMLIVETPLSQSAYTAAERRKAFYERAIERVEALPGVVRAGYVNFAPLTFAGGRSLIGVEDEPNPNGADLSRFIVATRFASTGYLEALGVPLLSGRFLDERDAPDAGLAVVVTQAMVERFWPDSEPIGRRMKLGPVDSDAPWITVVGVIGDVRGLRLDAEPEPELFLALSQQAGTVPPFVWPRHLVIRTMDDPERIAANISGAIREIDAAQPVASVRTMEELISSQVASRSTQLTLVGTFSVLALVLAAIGLYGVLTYDVAQRDGEIGLRMALGARGGDVIGHVLRNALTLTGIGVGAGLLGVFAGTRFLTSFLFGVQPLDPLTLIAVVALLFVVTIAAVAVPAARAARTEPAMALRGE